MVAGSDRLPDAHAAGLLTEYLPTADDLGVSPERWTAFVRDRLRHLVALYGPRAVLVGGLPHDGILAAIDDHPATRWLWLRPAMWRRGTGAGWAAHGPSFHGILEPGEFAAAGDEGWTTTSRSGVATVAPITNLPDRLPRRHRGAHTILCRGVEAALPGFRAVTAEPAQLGTVTVAVVPGRLRVLPRADRGAGADRLRARPGGPGRRTGPGPVRRRGRGGALRDRRRAAGGRPRPAGRPAGAHRAEPPGGGTGASATAPPTPRSGWPGTAGGEPIGRPTLPDDADDLALARRQAGHPHRPVALRRGRAGRGRTGPGPHPRPGPPVAPQPLVPDRPAADRPGPRPGPQRVLAREPGRPPVAPPLVGPGPGVPRADPRRPPGCRPGSTSRSGCPARRRTR